MQLSFAVVPLVMFTSEKSKMGAFVNPRWVQVLAWFVAALIGSLNAWLLVETFRGWF
jgi:manganese transport protein